jgi:hypothetical protein
MGIRDGKGFVGHVLVSCHLVTMFKLRVLQSLNELDSDRDDEKEIICKKTAVSFIKALSQHSS